MPFSPLVEAGSPAPYHHGDLANALVAAGLDLARHGGADAVTLREATRRAGVTPRAAYRHFADRDALVAAVAAEAVVAMAGDIVREVAGIRARDPRRKARARLGAVGTAYVSFARREPGWFDVGFFTEGAPVGARPSDAPHPFEQLTLALDDLVATGQLRARDKQAAAVQCWSSVHGFAALATRGPMALFPAEQVDAMAARLVADVVAAVARA